MGACGIFGAVYVQFRRLKHRGTSVVFRWGAASCYGNEAFNLSVRQTLWGYIRLHR